MSKSINLVVLTGRVGSDPEITEGTNFKVANFRLATSEGGYRRQDGTEVPEKTQWHTVKAWNSLVSACPYIHRGDLVTVTGRLEYNEWEKDGQKRISAEIVANNIVLPPKSGSAPYASSPSQYAPTPAAVPPYASMQPQAIPNDLPF